MGLCEFEASQIGGAIQGGLKKKMVNIIRDAKTDHDHKDIKNKQENETKFSEMSFAKGRSRGKHYYCLGLSLTGLIFTVLCEFKSSQACLFLCVMCMCVYI